MSWNKKKLLSALIITPSFGFTVAATVAFGNLNTANYETREYTIERMENDLANISNILSVDPATTTIGRVFIDIFLTDISGPDTQELFDMANDQYKSNPTVDIPTILRSTITDLNLHKLEVGSPSNNDPLIVNDVDELNDPSLYFTRKDTYQALKTNFQTNLTVEDSNKVLDTLFSNTVDTKMAAIFSAYGYDISTLSSHPIEDMRTDLQNRANDILEASDYIYADTNDYPFKDYLSVSGQIELAFDELFIENYANETSYQYKLEKWIIDQFEKEFIDKGPNHILTPNAGFSKTYIDLNMAELIPIDLTANQFDFHVLRGFNALVAAYAYDGSNGQATRRMRVNKIEWNYDDANESTTFDIFVDFIGWTATTSPHIITFELDTPNNKSNAEIVLESYNNFFAGLTSDEYEMAQVNAAEKDGTLTTDELKNVTPHRTNTFAGIDGITLPSGVTLTWSLTYDPAKDAIAQLALGVHDSNTGENLGSIYSISTHRYIHDAENIVKTLFETVNAAPIDENNVVANSVVLESDLTPLFDGYLATINSLKGVISPVTNTNKYEYEIKYGTYITGGTEVDLIWIIKDLDNPGLSVTGNVKVPVKVNNSRVNYYKSSILNSDILGHINNSNYLTFDTVVFSEADLTKIIFEFNKIMDESRTLKDVTIVWSAGQLIDDTIKIEFTITEVSQSPVQITFFAEIKYDGVIVDDAAKEEAINTIDKDKELADSVVDGLEIPQTDKDRLNAGVAAAAIAAAAAITGTENLSQAELDKILSDYKATVSALTDEAIEIYDENIKAELEELFPDGVPPAIEEALKDNLEKIKDLVDTDNIEQIAELLKHMSLDAILSIISKTNFATKVGILSIGALAGLSGIISSGVSIRTILSNARIKKISTKKGRSVDKASALIPTLIFITAVAVGVISFVFVFVTKGGL